MLAACCFGWFAVQSIVRAPRTAESSLPGADDSILRMLAAVVRRLDWRELTYLIAPFAILTTAHFLFRYGYYGEWLPNTYYAKHVRAWYESGFRYLWAAALETGLYLLLPLACVALRERWRRTPRRDLCAGAALYRRPSCTTCCGFGGDHFEYRPLDFYWPLLALPAAEGIAHLGARLAAGLQRVHWLPRHVEPRVGAIAVFVPVLCYASTVQGCPTVRRCLGIYIELERGERRMAAGGAGDAGARGHLQRPAPAVRLSSRQSHGERCGQHRDVRQSADTGCGNPMRRLRVGSSPTML